MPYSYFILLLNDRDGHDGHDDHDGRCHDGRCLNVICNHHLLLQQQQRKLP